MSKRVLIINRGEIAIRVAKALNELGHISVGVWTDNETEPPHLEYCQEWIHLKGNSNTETYLNIPQILDLISKHKIDAVHPGYGFLSENREFSETLEKKGITFIGPNANAVYKMGDKFIVLQRIGDTSYAVSIESDFNGVNFDQDIVNELNNW